MEEDELIKWKSSGFSPEEANAWKSENFCLGEAVAWKLLTGVSSPKDAKKWTLKKIPSPREAATWIFVGFSPEEADEWKNKEFFPGKAVIWKAFGFSPKEADEWEKAHFSLEEAVMCKALGIPLTQAISLKTKYDNLLNALKALINSPDNMVK